MTDQRQMHLGAFFHPTGHHVASWLHPEAQADAGTNFRHYVQLAQMSEAAKFDPAKHPGVVKSPMVGVAYLSAEPGAAPYVSLGQTVEAGATLLLIEAMKTFNQIKAPRAGTVKHILVAAGAPVEYDEPLLIIE